ncbi:MAG TPA: GAF domain-containing protein, partial [Terriglobales bacterium]|nr:GAF domain-containing protein [Terriglobales bacterium]
MNFLISIWNWGSTVVPKVTAQESVVLIILAACVVVYRTFGERYLLFWILGWMAYLVSRLPVPQGTGSEYALAISHNGEFVLAVGLFATSVLLYTKARKLLIPMAIFSAAMVGLAVAQTVLWPEELWLRVAWEVGYRIVAITGAVQLVRSRWGRWETGAWLLAGSMVMLQLDLSLLPWRVPAGVGLLSDLLLGVSMLLVVFDDSRARTRRLAVVNALTSSIARASQSGPMLLTALEELKQLINARAAWFRLQEDNRMVIAQQIGLSAEFVLARNSIALDDTLRTVIGDTKPTIVSAKTADGEMKDALKQEKFHHVLMVPVRGKKSVIGILSLGSRHWRSYTAEDLEFLETSAHQLGIAVENVKLMEQVLRSQRQWVNTFDSIQDLILVH